MKIEGNFISTMFEPVVRCDACCSKSSQLFDYNSFFPPGINFNLKPISIPPKKKYWMSKETKELKFLIASILKFGCNFSGHFFGISVLFWTSIVWLLVALSHKLKFSKRHGLLSRLTWNLMLTVRGSEMVLAGWGSILLLVYTCSSRFWLIITCVNQRWKKIQMTF